MDQNGSDPEGDRLAIYELAYREGFRILADQTRRLDQFRGQAITMIGITTAATGVLAGVVFNARGSNRDTWVLVAILIGAVLFLALLDRLRRVLRPIVEWKLYLSPKNIIEGYADHETPATIGETHKQLALHLQENADHNETGLTGIRRDLNLALTGVILDIAWWAILAGVIR